MNGSQLGHQGGVERYRGISSACISRLSLMHSKLFHPPASRHSNSNNNNNDKGTMASSSNVFTLTYNPSASATAAFKAVDDTVTATNTSTFPGMRREELQERIGELRKTNQTLFHRVPQRRP